MKREALVLVIGSLLLGSGEAEAQRNDRRGERERGGRVERLEPVRAPGRVVARPTYAPARHHRGARSTVVYTTRRHRPGYAARGGWVRVDWRRDMRPRAFYRPGHRAFLNRGELNDVLGRRVVRQIRDAGRAAGLRGKMRGHWVFDRRDAILVVSMGGTDIAEVVDFDSDGYFDEAYVLAHRGFRPMALGW